MKRSKAARPKRPRNSKLSPSKRLTRKSFPIVGIGASAGGLEAFKELLEHLPEKTGIALVLVQHLDPTHGSVLQEILSRTTKIPVTEATDGVVLEPDHAYVIPANTDLSIRGGALYLAARELTRGRHMPINRFLGSLAEDRGGQAIGVILSGTATDGTEGCEAIKLAGGIVFAQDEKSAKYASMPRSAVAAGCVDFVMSPARIARELVRLAEHPLVTREALLKEGVPAKAASADMDALFSMVQEATGVDFAHYKQTTLERRIKRRMVLNRFEKLKDYVHFVKTHPKEVDELYRDILINVTGFFREPGAFESLRVNVFPKLFKNRKPEELPVRIWVPGCSTGEEPYSIAMAALEFLWDQARAMPPFSGSRSLQIFATDISETALARARLGFYTEPAIADIPPERLKRFFERADGGYRISKTVREMCIFARQNAAKDPPFSNLDLVSCRNLLIYLGPLLQRRVVPALHYALKPEGFLMLGESESLSAFADHFTLIDKKYKVYQKKLSGAPLLTYFSGGDYAQHRPATAQTGHVSMPAPNVEKEVDRVLSDRFIPASIVVNSDMEIVQFRGRTGAYLEPAEGQPTFSLSKMAREGLLVDLRAALSKAKRGDARVRKEGVRVRSNGGTREVNLEVLPVRPLGGQHFFVVVFEDAVRPRAEGEKGKRQETAKAGSADARERRRATQEINQLRQQLQALIEDHETTLEEFKSANEEVLSANEELQSTNEELETAKEELQSSNEELTTLNEELQTRNQELSLANNDLLNLVGNANVPVVMLGNDLRIRRFTPPAEKLLNLLPGDVGRRIGEIRSNLEIDNLEKLSAQAIESATMQEAEVRERKDGAWHSVRVRPYKTFENRIDGAVISFQDIDALKRGMESMRSYPEALIENARVLQDSIGQKLTALNLSLEKLGGDLPESARATLDEFRSLVQAGMDDIHGLSHLVHSPLRGEAGVSSAIHWLLDEHSDGSALKVTAEVPKNLRRMPPEIEIMLFRVVQDALNNVLRHSGGKHAKIEISQTDHVVALTISDDGKGVPAEALSGGDGSELGVGLRGMRERLAQIGGTLEISAGAPGAVIRAEIPLSQK